MLRRHPEVPLWVTPLEVVKIKEEVYIKDFSTVKYPTDTIYFFLCWSSGGTTTHYLGQPWESS